MGNSDWRLAKTRPKSRIQLELNTTQPGHKEVDGMDGMDAPIAMRHRQRIFLHILRNIEWMLLYEGRAGRAGSEGSGL